MKFLSWFVQRWPLETTFEAVRAHEGLETPWQWNDRSVARTTPALLGLCSIVTLLAARLIGNKAAPVRMTTWYHQQQATFSETIALVRGALWGVHHVARSQAPTDLVNIPRALFERLADALCSAV